MNRLFEHLLVGKRGEKVDGWPMAGFSFRLTFAPQGWVTIYEDYFRLFIYLLGNEKRRSDEDRCIDTLDRRPGIGRDRAFWQAVQSLLTPQNQTWGLAFRVSLQAAHLKMSHFGGTGRVRVGYRV